MGKTTEELLVWLDMSYAEHHRGYEKKNAIRAIVTNQPNVERLAEAGAILIQEAQLGWTIVYIEHSEYDAYAKEMLAAIDAYAVALAAYRKGKE